MSEDPVRKYLDGKTKLDTALSEVEKLASIIEPIGSALKRDPWHVNTANTNVFLPIDIGHNVPTLDGKTWPSAKQIAEALAAMHKARHEVVNLWASVSVKDRESLTPPDQVY